MRLDRADIREDRPGIPLALTVHVVQVDENGCTPLEGAIVEIWHCDASGLYSAFEAEGTGDETFLRGYQTTNADGAVQFTTIYPGWYRGRTVHIHFKVHTTDTAGDNYEFTSQMYFDDSLSTFVYGQDPYDDRGAQRDTTNANVGIYRNSGGQLMVAMTETDEGYTGILNIGLVLSDTAVGADDGFSQPGGGPGGPPPGGLSFLRRAGPPTISVNEKASW